MIGWGVKNNKDFTIRARNAEILLHGALFENQQYFEPRVLRGVAGAASNFVESIWEIKAHNSALAEDIGFHFHLFIPEIPVIGSKWCGR